MFRIFERFSEDYIPEFIKRKCVYLVSQTYYNAVDHFSDTPVNCILMTDYPDKEYASVHYNAIKEDRFASIIDLTSQRHKSKLIEMLKEGSGYEVYWAAVKDPSEIKRRLEKKYSDQIRRYLQNETKWLIRGNEKIKVDLQVIFGELFVIIKRNKDLIRIKLSDIEKG